MCDVLNIPKSTYYYHADLTGKRAKKAEDKELSKEIARIFKESRNNYGTRKIKKRTGQVNKTLEGISPSNWSINEQNGSCIQLHSRAI